MKNIFNYLLFFLISFTIIFIFPKADSCNYKEQAALNKEAKNVTFNYEIVDKLDELNSKENPSQYNIRDYYYIQMNLTNITDNLYVEITNNQNDEKLTYYSSDLVDGVVSFKANNDKVVTYTLNIYAQTDTCSRKLMTRTVKSPKFNTFYHRGMCIDVPEYKYCQEVITSEMDDNKIGKSITNYYNKQMANQKQETQKEKNNIKKYLIIGSIVLGSIIVIGGIILIIVKIMRKRRGI